MLNCYNCLHYAKDKNKNICNQSDPWIIPEEFLNGCESHWGELTLKKNAEHTTTKAIKC